MLLETFRAYGAKNTGIGGQTLFEKDPRQLAIITNLKMTAYDYFHDPLRGLSVPSGDFRFTIWRFPAFNFLPGLQ
ncbi:MAG: hypothetical protein Q7W05_14970, partial [Deltaproteobacteria bacterium]|nr:hypothetical protein [Deltaproteobacteria bacterium]